MVNGDMHNMAYDIGAKIGARDGNLFPIYQCAPLDQKRGCKKEHVYSGGRHFGNGQYCLFKFRAEKTAEGDQRLCMKYEGYEGDQIVQTHDRCKEHHFLAQVDGDYERLLDYLDRYHNMTQETMRPSDIPSMARLARENRQRSIEAGKEVVADAAYDLL